jgi:hypothetical protein
MRRPDRSPRTRETPVTARLLLPALLLAAPLACGRPEEVRPAREAAAQRDPEEAGKARGAERAARAQEERRAQILDERLTMEDQPGRTVPLVRSDSLPEGAPHLVALVVLDTLRADRTSLCGYTKPNTPVLNQLRELGAATTCDAYSPATWTLPAHASYFTGEPTSAHGVHTLGTPLAPEFETLAESYAARGYQTLFISANPVFNKAASGFWQGFDRVVIAKGLTGPLRSESFARVVESELARLDPEKPVFLFVNIFDAHDPYPPVPEGLSWAKAMPRENLHPHTADPANPYYAFVTGAMKPEDQPGYLDRIQNSYDHAILVADRNLGALVRLLKQDKWLRRPHRVVITSDHGEHLGEHGLLRHGSATWQTVTRIPFLVMDTTRESPHTLPAVLNATATHQLLLHGTLPETPLLVESASAYNEDDFKPSWMTLSLWNSPIDKIMVFDGKRWRFDLEKDPMESNPLPLPDEHPLAPTMAERLAAHEASIAKALAEGPNAELMEMLKEVGYVQDDGKVEAPEEAGPTP